MIIFSNVISELEQAYQLYKNSRVFTGLCDSCLMKSFEPAHDKTNKMTCVPSEYSDQPAHTLSLIRVFAARMKIP